jgi:hypothetical protein
MHAQVCSEGSVSSDILSNITLGARNIRYTCSPSSCLSFLASNDLLITIPICVLVHDLPFLKYPNDGKIIIMNIEKICHHQVCMLVGTVPVFAM